MLTAAWSHSNWFISAPPTTVTVCVQAIAPIASVSLTDDTLIVNITEYAPASQPDEMNWNMLENSLLLIANSGVSTIVISVPPAHYHTMTLPNQIFLRDWNHFS